jgi:hypothetical protein
MGHDLQVGFWLPTNPLTTVGGRSNNAQGVQFGQESACCAYAVLSVADQAMEARILG